MYSSGTKLSRRRWMLPPRQLATTVDDAGEPSPPAFERLPPPAAGVATAGADVVALPWTSAMRGRCGRALGVKDAR
eukprot:CAMPEP_0113672230 /NCGR_PEP_ID=MMETSP0038_2-20120614/6144_1 /TAXON_ID=2898 /ORGANISM="Cryptomonas paramecium" /LENGTH=75 /DNA_ID=CAMNT_0000588469 /DNA_START=159 /DNA_END=386 /DNA_ORIENTATION=- /assembly_acc=CAM_ASM_000170